MAEFVQPTTTPSDGPPRMVKILLVLLTAVVAPAILVANVVVQSPQLSVLDEPAHLDYLRRVEQGELPRIGDLLERETIRDIQCVTVQGRTTAPCGLPLEDYESTMAGAAGYSYEAQQPPLYYAITAVLRQVTRIGPADHFVTTARLTGIAWLSAGLLVFWLAARRLGLGWWPTAVLTGLLTVSPGVLYQSATINNDAAAILTGSLSLLLFADLRGRCTWRRSALWSAVAALLVLTKPTGVIAIAAAVGALFVDALLDGRLTKRRAAAYGAPLGAGVLTYLLWGVVRDARAVVDYDVVLDALLGFKQVDSFPFNDVVEAVPRLLGAYWGAAVIGPPFVRAVAQLVVYVLVAGALAALWKARGGVATERIAGVALAVILLAGPAFTVLFYVDYSVEGGPTSRYGLSLLPLLAIGTGELTRTRRATVTLALLGAAVLVAVLVAINVPTSREG